MSTPRRDFLAALSGAAILGSLPSSLSADPTGTIDDAPPVGGRSDWDMSWMKRLTGKYKVVFDASDLEGGFPIVRANAVGMQYADVFGVPLSQVSRVLVIRHAAIHFAMNDAYWARFKVGAETKFKGADGKSLTINPVRIPHTGMPEPFRPLMLQPFQAGGGEVLACALALQHSVVPKYVEAGMSAEAALAAAKADMLPGIILQPSGVFAVSVAQDAGCSFVPASASA
ncbi:MAG: hypothetical protein ABIR59_13160 [Gemmatimonadales bacterium]